MVLAARELVGTPFRHQGRVPGVGLDCAGICVLSFAAAGVELRFPTVYTRQPSPAFFRAWLDDLTRLVGTDLSCAMPGDVLAFRIGRRLQHLAIYTGDGMMIHTQQGESAAETKVVDCRGWRLVEVRRVA